MSTTSSKKRKNFGTLDDKTGGSINKKTCNENDAKKIFNEIKKKAAENLEQNIQSQQENKNLESPINFQENNCNPADVNNAIQSFEGSKLVHDLKEWALEYNVKNSDLDSLLKILKPYHVKRPTPSDASLEIDDSLTACEGMCH